jgi:hypothetical protein
MCLSRCADNIPQRFGVSELTPGSPDMPARMQMAARLTHFAGFMSLIAICAAMPACTTTLEQLVEQHHQERIDAANANLPVNRGATDGMGSYMADTSPHLTVQATDQHGDKHP